jgi:predicted O-methyltransferase YrrM
MENKTKLIKAKFGDTVKFHVTCKRNDDSVIETSIGHEPQILTIGEGKFISDLELAISGMVPGEKKTVTLSWHKAPGPYRKDLAGKDLIFDIEFLEILKRSDFAEYFEKTEGMISLEEAILLYDLAKNTKDNCIVEVGSYRGRSTVALGLGSLDGYQVPVFAIEPHEEFMGILGGVFGPQDRGAFYKAMIDTSCYLIVRLINLTSDRVAPTWNQKIGLLWIDGDHSYEGVKRDFDCWFSHLAAGATIAFDDSTSPRLGPYRLMNELLRTGNFEKAQATGKITVLRLLS